MAEDGRDAKRDDPTAAETRIVVVDAGRRFVHGAALVAVCPDDGASDPDSLVDRLGASDERGELVVERARLAGRIVVATSSSGRGDAFVDDPAPPTVTIRLRASSVISGRVVRDVTREPVGGTLVVAIPAAFRGARAVEIRRALAGDPRIPTTISAEDGAFAIEGLAAGRAYDLFAGGKGLASAPLHAPILAGTRDIELAVAMCFGVIAQFVDPDLRPLDTRDGTDWPMRVTATMRGAPGLALEPASWLLPRWPAMESAPEDGGLWWGWAVPPGAPPGLVAVVHAIAGYRPGRAEWFAQAVHVAVPLEIPLEADHDGAGRLEIVVAHRAGEPRAIAGTGGAALRVTRGGEVRSIEWRALDRDGRWEGAMPPGEWTVDVADAFGSALPLRDGPVTCVVTAAMTTRVELALDGERVGAVRFVPLEADGEAYVGPLHVRLMAMSASDGGAPAVSRFTDLAFSAPPYVVPAISPGTYVAFPMSPRGSDAARQPFDVGADALTIRELTLRDSDSQDG